jgi:hypothetical protein
LDFDFTDETTAVFFFVTVRALLPTVRARVPVALAVTTGLRVLGDFLVFDRTAPDRSPASEKLSKNTIIRKWETGLIIVSFGLSTFVSPSVLHVTF